MRESPSDYQRIAVAAAVGQEVVGVDAAEEVEVDFVAFVDVP